MAIFPTQTRTVDPYADFLSSNVNRLTRVKTRGRSVIVKPGDLEVSINSTDSTTQLDISAGECIIDDMYISIEATTVDIIDDVNLFTTGTPPTTDGTYYLTIYYSYSKSRPAPRAGFVMLRPNELSLISSDNYLFLAKINCVTGTSTLEIDSIETYDTENEEAVRQFSDAFAGIYPTEPTFMQNIHEGSIIYTEDTNSILYGTHTQFVNLNSNMMILDTTNCTVGDLAYINSSGKTVQSNANASGSLAMVLVISVGTASNKDGIAIFNGRSQVNVTGAVTSGQKLYLSTTLGKATSTPPGNVQYIGIALSSGTNTLVDVWFAPGPPVL